MNAQLFAVQLSQAVDAFRESGPDATERQKSALRALVALVKTEGVHLRYDDAGLEVSGERIRSPAATALVRLLRDHEIAEVRIAAGAPAADVFNLLKAVADFPGSFPEGEGVEGRLRQSAAHSIAIVPVLPPPPAEPTLSSARVTGSGDGITRADDFAIEHAADPILSEEPAEEVSASRSPLPESDFVITHSTEDFAEQHEAMLPPPAPPSPTPVASLPSPAAAVLPKGTLNELVAQIAENPAVPNVGDLLARLGGMVDEAVRRDRLEQAVEGLHTLIETEGRLPEGSERRQFGIMLKRTITRPVLQAAARLVALQPHTEKAVAVLRRAGADGTEVLLDLLIAAPTVSERRTYFDALRSMKEGAQLLIHHLTHHEWFVARNVAELVGELGLEEALPELGKLLNHADVRVRKAAALAVAKIGTSKSLDPLRRALKDDSVEVRTQVAVGIGGRKSSALAMPLVVALEEEPDETVQRELILALGRIGTPDAVQALIKLAEPAGGLFRRKPASLRLAAVEALALVGSAAAKGMLQGLSKDGDRDVRDAAGRALKMATRA